MMTLLHCVTCASKKSAYKMTEVRELVLNYANDEDVNLRDGATIALREICPEQDDVLLVKLSQDKEWLVRDSAHIAAKNIDFPSSALVCATAKDLGDYDGYDEAPHYWALEALIHWKEKAAPAISIIEQWLRQEGLTQEHYHPDSTMDLVDGLGRAALSLLPLLKCFNAEYILQKELKEKEEVDDSDDEDALCENGIDLDFDAMEMLGIDTESLKK